MELVYKRLSKETMNQKIFMHQLATWKKKTLLGAEWYLALW